MFEGFTKDSIDFLFELGLNNNREWFMQNKERFIVSVNKPMKELADELYGKFCTEFPQYDLNLHISRIYRDARRLHGGAPYRDFIWLDIRPQPIDWHEHPSFWFEIGHETWSYGLGFHSAKPATMANLRRDIDAESPKFVELAECFSKQVEFILDGERYKREKRTCGEPYSEWYNLKNYSLIHEESVGRILTSHKLVDRIYDGFVFLEPFFNYFLSIEARDEPAVK